MLKAFAFLTAFALAAISCSAKAEYTAAEMAEKLNASVAELQTGQGWCTATKIGHRKWLTAGHCVTRNGKLVTEEGYLYPRSITVSVSEKEDGKRLEDWAIMNTATDYDTVPALELGCSEELYQGMPVAYLGFPAGADRAFMQGYISSVRKVRGGYNDADWVIDVPVAGGASGSAIVSMETGRIIGVLTEGVYSQRTGFFLAAAESIRNLDTCEDLNRWFKTGGDVDSTYDSLPAADAHLDRLGTT